MARRTKMDMVTARAKTAVPSKPVMVPRTGTKRYLTRAKTVSERATIW